MRYPSLVSVLVDTTTGELRGSKTLPQPALSLPSTLTEL